MIIVIIFVMLELTEYAKWNIYKIKGRMKITTWLQFSDKSMNIPWEVTKIQKKENNLYILQRYIEDNY